MEPLFTVEAARALLPELKARAEQVVRLRVELVEGRAAMERGAQPAGGIAQVKSIEAHLQEAVDWFIDNGVQLKGLAPLIVDFPSEVAGEPALLCWLEGEPALEWYHRPDVGFMGRRRLPDS